MLHIAIGIVLVIILSLSGIIYHLKTILNNSHTRIIELSTLLVECKSNNVSLGEHIRKQNDAINDYVQKNILLNKRINDSIKTMKTLTTDYELKLNKLQNEVVNYKESKCDTTVIYKDKSEWLNDTWRNLFFIKKYNNDGSEGK